MKSRISVRSVSFVTAFFAGFAAISLLASLLPHNLSDGQFFMLMAESWMVFSTLGYAAYELVKPRLGVSFKRFILSLVAGVPLWVVAAWVYLMIRF